MKTQVTTLLAGAALSLLAACASDVSYHGDDYHPPHEHGEIVVPEPVVLECTGALTQGGAARCKTNPGAEVRVDGQSVGYTDPDGWITVHFSPDAPSIVRVEAHRAQVFTYVDLSIEPR